MNLGENIYRLRSERNMSQGDLADSLEVSRQSVSKWENNSATPELEKLKKMGELFGITLDELVYGNRGQVASLQQAEQTKQTEQIEEEKDTPSIKAFEGLLRFTVIMLAIGFALIFNGLLLGFFSEQLRDIEVWCGLMCLVASGVGALFLLGN